MGFFSFWNNESGNTTELVAPYTFGIKERIFIDVKTQNLYERIMKRCFHKTSGYNKKNSDNISYSVFFNSEEGSQDNGTIPLVARAMTDKARIYLVYDSNTGLVKKANSDQQKIIDDKYNTVNNTVSSLGAGLFGMKLDFSKYIMTDLVKCYMGMIYSIMKSANTQIKLSESLQIKIDKLRENISTNSKDDANTQALGIVNALKDGHSILISAGDSVVQTIINSESIDSALDMVNSLLASDIGLSLSFVSGKLTSGMSATGDADINYEDTGIKDYWVSVWKPICNKLYDSPDVKYKSDRWRSLESAMRSLTLIENSGIIPEETKQKLVNEILDEE